MFVAKLTRLPISTTSLSITNCKFSSIDNIHTNLIQSIPPIPQNLRLQPPQQRRSLITNSSLSSVNRTNRTMSSTEGPNAVVIAGPSGVGKGTLIEKLRAEYATLFGFSVSHTSRAPRPGEENGVHYHFTTAENILKDVSEGKFIEHAEVHGRHYGTSIAAVQSVREQGKICILDIDVQGCRSARKKGLEATYVFVAPPCMEALEQRLRGRGTETEDAIVKRLGNAAKEIEAKDEKGLFDAIIVNDDLDKAYTELKSLLQNDIEASTKAQQL